MSKMSHWPFRSKHWYHIQDLYAAQMKNRKTKNKRQLHGSNMRPRTDVMPKLGPRIGLFKSRALDHSAKLTVLVDVATLVHRSMADCDHHLAVS